MTDIDEQVNALKTEFAQLNQQLEDTTNTIPTYEEMNKDAVKKKTLGDYQRMFYSMVSKKSKDNMLKVYKQYMYLIAILGNIFLYISFIKILINKSSENVSLLAFIVYLISSISWFIYGYLLEDNVLILSGLLAIIGDVLLIIAIIAYSPDTGVSIFEEQQQPLQQQQDHLKKKKSVKSNKKK